MDSDELLTSQVYAELRRIAASKIAAEAPGQTIDASALVHEAWLRLADASVEWQDRTHYLRTAATAMRRILVDRARVKLAAKRGGEAVREDLTDLPAPLPDEKLLALNEALEKLALEKPELAKLIELRFFLRLGGDEAATVLGLSPATADRRWTYARAWLQLELDA